MGVISLQKPLQEEDEKTVKNMAAMLLHRGPNHTGFYRDNKVYLGNSRLSVIDRAKRSNLPFLDNKEEVAICYNGEVSNYIELKHKYKLDKKYPFKGHSDTEVLIYLYKELGIKFLAELSGMFSFCLYDKKKQIVYLARDFFGINPHFYCHHNRKIYFASEIKALLEVPGIDLTINTQGIFDFLSFAYIPGTQTPYCGIKELRNGQLIEIELNLGRFERRYHFRAKYNTNSSITEEEASDKVYNLLINSVARNLRSDVPIGTTLSGGVDTSGIICLIKDLGKSKDFHSFSIRMGEKSFDESYYQQLVAQSCNTAHHEVLITPEQVIENFYEHIAYLDEPSGKWGIVALLYFS